MRLGLEFSELFEGKLLKYFGPQKDGHPAAFDLLELIPYSNSEAFRSNSCGIHSESEVVEMSGQLQSFTLIYRFKPFSVEILDLHSSVLSPEIAA